MTASARMQEVRYASNIQLLRFLAAMCVAICHAKNIALNYSIAIDDRTVALASFGVDLFFVISGFIMVYTTAQLSGTARESWLFFKRRLIRVVPLYWAMTTVMLLLLLLLPSVFRNLTLDPMHALTSYLFIPYTSQFGSDQPLVAVGWTLSYEMYFYVVFALALWLSQRWRVWIITVFFAASVLLQHVVPEYTFLTNARLIDFVLGGWVAQAVLDRKLLPGWVSVLALVAAGAAVLYFDVNTYRAATISAVMVWAMVSLEMGRGYRVPRWAVMLGNGTFALYVIHNFLFTALHRVWLMVFGELPNMYVFMAVALGGVIVAAHIVYTYLERPVTEYLKRRYAQP